MKQAEFAKVVSALVARGSPFAVATVVKAEGASLAEPGFKVIISSEGEVLFGSLGGGCPESAISGASRKTLRTGVPKVVKVYLEKTEKAVGATVKSQNDDEIHVETDRGGELEVYLEPFLPQQRLVLIGQGGKDDVEDSLVRQGKGLEFEVVVIDHSPVLSEQPDLLIKEHDFSLDEFQFNPSDSVVVLTKGGRDIEILQELSKHPLRYVGLLASAQRARDNANRLRESGISDDFLGRLSSPVGADIGAVTPDEIALSILAEAVAAKYGRSLPRKAPSEGEKPRKAGA